MIDVITDTSAFDDDIRQLERRLGNLRPVMQGIGALLENRIRDRRETLTDPNGLRWAEWAESTRLTYPASGRGKLLDRTGAMWDRTGPQWTATESSVRVGFDKGYATYHEFGTDKMPRRGLLFADPNNGTLGADDEQAITDLLQDWLSGVFD
jgi:phage gpG-like protein